MILGQSNQQLDATRVSPRPSISFPSPSPSSSSLGGAMLQKKWPYKSCCNKYLFSLCLQAWMATHFEKTLNMLLSLCPLIHIFCFVLYEKMTTKLTENAISTILYGPTHIQPYLQIVELDPIHSVRNSAPQYRTAISDGTHKKHIILPKDCNVLVATGLLQKGSIINVKSWTTSSIGPST